MTVKELIEKLSVMPPDSVVVYFDDEYNRYWTIRNPIEQIKLKQITEKGVPIFIDDLDFDGYGNFGIKNCILL